MLNCSGASKAMVTDDRPPTPGGQPPGPVRYSTHCGPRPRAADLGGGSRPRPGESGGHSARRCRRGARPAPAARNRRHHCGDDGPRCRGEARHPGLQRRAAPATRLHRRRIRRRVPRHRVPATGDGDRPTSRPRTQFDAARPPRARGRERASGPRTRRRPRGCRGPESTRERRPYRISRRHQAALGPPAHRGVPERRLPCGAVRELHRPGGTPRAGPGSDPPSAALQPPLAQRGDPLRPDELRGSGRAPGILRVAGRRRGRRGRAHDRDPRSDPRRGGAGGASRVTLSGRGAVVTGAGRGIGMAVARALAGAGAAVVVVARTRNGIEAVATELRAAGRQAWAVPGDVTDPATVAALARAAETRLKNVDILVNNAGVAHSAPLAKLTLEDWNRVLTVNATGTFLCTRAFLPGMLERRWGRVVNIASVAGLRGGKYIAAYSAAKHAVIGFTRSVAAEVAGSGVTVNAVCPGYVDTDMTRESVARIATKTGMSPEAALRAALESTGQHRLISPEEVARAVLTLCDDAARDTNGETVVIAEGGMPMTFRIVNPDALGRPSGWNNGMLAAAGGRVLFVAGQTAPERAGLVEQWAGALERVLEVVRAAGGGPEQIGRLTVYVTDRQTYIASLKPLGEVHRRLMGRHYPAIALLEVRGLVDANAVVEIEATAVLP